MRLTIIAAVIVTFALSACGKLQPMPTQAFAKPGVTIRLDPPAAPNCKPDTVYRATLYWTVDGVQAPRTEVRMERPDGQVFARSNDKSAHAETDNWVKPGMWFLLFDRHSGEMIASLQAGPKPCP